MEVKWVSSKEEKLGSLTGSIDTYSGERKIRLILSIDGFTEDNKKNGFIKRVYLIADSGQSYIELRKANVTGLSFPVEITGMTINSIGNSSFTVIVNRQQLKYIGENLLSGDITVNWKITGFGFIEYEDKQCFGNIEISNTHRTDGTVSQKKFIENVWNKISNEERYLIDMPGLDLNIFEAAKNNIDNVTLKDLFEMMQNRTSQLKETMEKYEYANGKATFIDLAENIKGILDKLKFNVKTANDNSQEVLEGLLFNNLFSGPGTNSASEGMMQGIIQIFTGLTKISNQIGHLATDIRDGSQYYSFSGDKDTIMTFLFITDLLFNYIGKRLEN